MSLKVSINHLCFFCGGHIYSSYYSTKRGDMQDDFGIFAKKVFGGGLMSGSGEAIAEGLGNSL